MGIGDWDAVGGEQKCDRERELLMAVSNAWTPLARSTWQVFPRRRWRSWPGPAWHGHTEHSSLPSRHHLVMCLLWAPNIFMRRLINAFSFYLHCPAPSFGEQSKHGHLDGIRKKANNTRRYFCFLSKNLISNSCRHLAGLSSAAAYLSYALCAPSVCVCVCGRMMRIISLWIYMGRIISGSVSSGSIKWITAGSRPLKDTSIFIKYSGNGWLFKVSWLPL